MYVWYMVGVGFGSLILFFVVVMLSFLIFSFYLSLDFKNKIMGMSFFFKINFLLMCLVFMTSIVVSVSNSAVLLSSGKYWLNNGLIFNFDFYSIMFFFVGFLVCWSIFNFSVKYMMDESHFVMFTIMLMLFLFFMMLLVSSGNFLFLFVSWESVGIMSYILISWWFGRMEAVNNSLQAIIYNRIGDFSIIIFFSVLVWGGDSLLMVHGEWFISKLVFFFFFFSVMAKSSQFFFHPWLPNAMESPTPVSSLLHSSTMVVASVFLMMRMLTVMGESFLYVFLVGVLTSLFSSLMSLMSLDVKKVIAFSTTSQLGFMMMALGLGFKFFVLFYMMMHAFFKAMMFMLSGVMIHGGMNAQDLRSVGVHSSEYETFSFMVMLMSGVVMFGFPFFSSFWIKDVFFEGLMSGSLNRFFWLLSLLSFFVTCIYTWRLFFFLTKSPICSSWKIMGMMKVSDVWDFVRLSVSSIVAGWFYFFFFGPVTEIVVWGFVKLGPLLLIFLSYVLMIMNNSWFPYLSWIRNYLLGFNPLIHKVMGGVSLELGLLLTYFDYIYLEFLLPRSFGEVVKKMEGVFWIAVMVFLLFLLVYFMFLY